MTRRLPSRRSETKLKTMNPTNILYALLAAGAGGCLALQASANRKFNLNLGGHVAPNAPFYTAAAWASFFSICGTILVACVTMLILRPPLPTKEAIGSTQWWNWIGGPLGTLIVLAGATLTQKLGSAAFVALLVGGQLLMSMLLDHFGWMGWPEVKITWGRALGALLIVGGVLCVKFL